MARSHQVAGCALAAVLATLALAGSAPAATIPVTTTDDVTGADLECSLREAVSAANNNDTGPSGDCADGDVIGDLVSLPTSLTPYEISAGQIDVNTGMTIAGAGTAATVIDANSTSRVFAINVTVAEIRDLTVREGATLVGGDGGVGPDQGASTGMSSTGGAGDSANDGGGIYVNLAILTLTRVLVTQCLTGSGGDGGVGGNGGSGGAGQAGGNSTGGAGGNGGSGGGIFSNGTLVVVDSQITENGTGNGGRGGDGGAAGDGGVGATGAAGGNSTGGMGGSGGSGAGIFVTSGGSVSLENSLVSRNFAGPGGNGGDGGNAGVGGPGTGGPGGNGGNSTGGQGFFGGFGGGIESDGPLSLTDSTIRENGAGNGGNGGDGGAGGDGQAGTSGQGAGGDSIGGNGGLGAGGGILTFSSSENIVRSAIVENGAGQGGVGGDGAGGGASSGTPGDSDGGNGGGGGGPGGLSHIGSGTVNVTSSTFAGNDGGTGGDGGLGGSGPGTCTSGDGGIAGGPGGIRGDAGATLNLNHITVADEFQGGGGAAGSPGNCTSGTPGGGFGVHGIVAGGATVNLRNSLLEGFVGSNNCGGVITDGGNNLSFPDTDVSCPADVTEDPLLGELEDNGGPTPTMGLAAGSPAIDAVPQSGSQCPATDQRGVIRPKGADCDIGAVEYSPPTATTGDASAITATGAALAGTVGPGNLTTGYRFEYGTTTAYGAQTDVTDAGAGADDVPAAASLTGLAPGTTYHYRLVATNPDATANGVDRTFTTTAAPVVQPPLGEFAGVTILTERARANKKGRVTIEVQCPADAIGRCDGTLSQSTQVKARKKKRRRASASKTLKLGTATFSIAPGQTAKVRIKLPKAGRKRLKKRKSIKANVTAVARDGRGVSKTTKDKVTLRAPKKKKPKKSN